MCQSERLALKRKQIWLNILEVPQNVVDFKAMRQKVDLMPELISNVEEVIALDVQRSEHQMPGVDPKVLIGVLRTYALYNPEIEYCQGMNYVAGFLLMVFEDEEIAFKALITIV